MNDDAAGNMTCRAPTSSQTCAGSTPTGEPLTYDIEGRLFKWQNQPNPSTSQTSTLYDGDGVRVAEQTTTTGLGGGTTTSIDLVSSGSGRLLTGHLRYLYLPDPKATESGSALRAPPSVTPSRLTAQINTSGAGRGNT